MGGPGLWRPGDRIPGPTLRRVGERTNDRRRLLGDDRLDELHRDRRATRDVALPSDRRERQVARRREPGERACLGARLTDPHDQRLGPARHFGRRLRGQRLGSDRVRIRRSHPGHVHSADLVQHQPLPGDRCQRPLPTNVSPTSANFNMRFAASASSARLASTSTFAGVDQRHARHPWECRQPVGCVTGTTQTASRPPFRRFPRPRSPTIYALASMSGDRAGAPRSSIRPQSRSSRRRSLALYDEVFTDRLGGGPQTAPGRWWRVAAPRTSAPRPGPPPSHRAAICG